MTHDALRDWLERNCSYTELCIMRGEYTPLKELPSVEDDLPGNVKCDLAMQRAQVRRWRRV